MIDSVILGTMTMNAGKGIPGSTIRWALRHNFSHFRKVVVVDGHLTDEAKAFYAQFSNVQVIDSPWTDSYVTQYRKFADTLSDGEWGLWLDDDEICSPELLEIMSKGRVSGFGLPKIIRIPCILHLTEDGTNFYAAEPNPKVHYEGQWTKSILFKKDADLDFNYFGSHVLPYSKAEGPQYLHKPYYHMKSLESFVYNDVWQAFLSPEGQGYSEVESKKFKMFTSCYSSTKEFKQATKNGEWSPMLKKFAWDYRRQYTRAISRLAWTYFILEGHEMPEADEFMTWDNMKQYVLSPETMSIYNENKKNNIGIKINEE